MADLIQFRRDTAANWTANNPILALGEPGQETDTRNIKIGDGVTAWNSLGYTISPTGLQVANNLSDLASIATALANLGIAGLPTPYSVSSGAVSSGVAAYITSLSNSSMKIAATSTNVTLRQSDGTPEKITADYTITGMSSNGTYSIIKPKGVNPIATLSAITESNIAPSSPATNDLWLNTGVKPYQPQQWNGSIWTAYQFVKLGEVTISGGVMGTPISYAFNHYYNSGWINSIPTSTTFNTFITNIGLDPSFCATTMSLKCLTAEAGYSIGDVITIVSKNWSGSGYGASTVVATKNTIGFSSSTNTFVVVSKATNTTTTLTPANWAYNLTVKGNI